MITYRYAFAFADGRMKMLNAPANLDVFAFTLHESTEDSVGALESLFHVYLKE
ncbi:MAG: hypothetical protein MCM46_17615 [Candidatus Manganitrophus sp. SB1]|nr:hypothetical protein [Candidatus Manganitrophus morganii]